MNKIRNKKYNSVRDLFTRKFFNHNIFQLYLFNYSLKLFSINLILD